MKKFRLITLALSFIIAFSAFALVGCNNGGDDTTDKEPVNIAKLGYLEDFGNEINITSVFDDDNGNRNQAIDGGNENYYYGEEVVVAKRIFLSHLDVPKGEYTAKIGDINLGTINVSSLGEADLTSLPLGLTLGAKYELTCTTSYGKPYTQTIRLVSRAVDDYAEYVNMINYYSIFTKRNAGTCDCEPLQVNLTSPCPHLNPGKFYDGVNFSQRLYVLDKDIYITQAVKWLGIKGIWAEDGGVHCYRDPYANLQSLSCCYFFDKLDGQGHTISIEEIHNYGLFGNITSIAEVKNFAFNLARINTYGWDNYYGTGEGYQQDLMERFTKGKNFIAGTISSGAVVQNVAIYASIERWYMYGINAIADVIKNGATIKDVYLALPSNLYFGAFSEHNHTNSNLKDPEQLEIHRYLSGFIGYGCELNAIDNLVVISPNLDYAFYREIGGEMVKFYAGNSNADDYVEGVSLYSTAEEAVHGGCATVGTWSISETGIPTYVGEI